MYCKLAAIALLALAGCREAATKIPRQAAQQTAVLRFENLGGADSDWQGRALSELLKRRFGAERMPRAGSVAPGISTERLPALSAGATRLITGYYTSANGSLNVTAFAEDAKTQKLTGPVRASGSLPQVTTALAQEFGAAQADSRYAASPAVREYALGSDTAGPAAASHYRLALEADPNFGPAYLGLLQSDPAHARETLAAVVLRSQSFANDPEILRALADFEMATRKPAEAAHHYRQIIALDPSDPGLRNLLAYALMYAGDEAGARAAAEEYQRLAPKDPNALDTRGDIELAFGHFSEAEKDYAATPWKAARARLLAGDVAGATAIFEREPKSPATPYRAAEWKYLTGHREEGMAAMTAFAKSAQQPELRSAAYAQAAIWAVLAQDKQHAAEWATAAVHPSVPSTLVAAALAGFLAQPSANADTFFAGDNAAPVRQRATGLQLVLAGRYEQALPIWKQIYENTDVGDALPRYLYGMALLKTGHKDEAAPLLRLNPIPSAGISPSFESLYLSALRQ